VILDGASIWFASKQNDAFHNNLWKLMESELKILAKPNEIPSYSAFAAMLLDIPQGLRKLLLRLDFIMLLGVESGDALTNSIVNALDQVSVTKSADSINEPIATPWGKTSQFLQVLLQSEGTINRLVFESSKRQSLWKGVFLRNEAIVKFLNGDVDQDTRVNLCAAFNSSLLPDILVCTAIGSEGIDLHTHCAEVIHHDLPWNPAKIEQRTGRVDRVGSLVEAIGDYKHFRLNIGIPFLSHNYEKFKYDLVHSRAQKFEILLGKPDFPIDVADEDRVDASGNEVKVEEAQDDEKDTHTDTVACLPDELIKYLEIDLSVYPKAKEAVIIA
jgi:superfamily II DNA/RNA helicase